MKQHYRESGVLYVLVWFLTQDCVVGTRRHRADPTDLGSTSLSVDLLRLPSGSADVVSPGSVPRSTAQSQGAPEPLFSSLEKTDYNENKDNIQ